MLPMHGAYFCVTYTFIEFSFAYQCDNSTKDTCISIDIFTMRIKSTSVTTVLCLPEGCSENNADIYRVWCP